MTGRFLIDTNILVYAYDRSEIEKQKKAADILDMLTQNNAGVISIQTLSEFFVVTTKKISSPLTIDEAHSSITNYVRSWQIIDINSFIVLEAIRGVKVHNFSYWDSMIWAAARMNQIANVLSEDFSVNSVIEGVRFINPFKQKVVLD
jgi:predicted nucleic acid-binding protein